MLCDRHHNVHHSIDQSNKKNILHYTLKTEQLVWGAKT